MICLAAGLTGAIRRQALLGQHCIWDSKLPVALDVRQQSHHRSTLISDPLGSPVYLLTTEPPTAASSTAAGGGSSGDCGNAGNSGGRGASTAAQAGPRGGRSALGNGLAAGFLTGKGRVSDREGFLSAEAREAAKASSGKVTPAQASTVCFWEEDLLEEGGEVDKALAAAEAAGCDMILQELKGSNTSVYDGFEGVRRMPRLLGNPVWNHGGCGGGWQVDEDAGVQQGRKCHHPVQSGPMVFACSCCGCLIAPTGGANTASP